MVSLAAVLLLASCDPEHRGDPDADTPLDDAEILRDGDVVAVALGAATPAAPAVDALRPALRVDRPAVRGDEPTSSASALPVVATDVTAVADHALADSADSIDEPPAGFHFAFTHERTYVVLRAHTEPGWGEGPLSLAQRQSPTVVVRDAGSGAPSRDLTGTRMVLRRRDDVACVAQLGPPQLLRRAYARWEQNAAWEGEDGASRASDAQVAEEAWEIAIESELLVAVATPIEGDCNGAHWAHPEHAQPDLGEAPIPQARIVRAFRGLDAHREYQSAWADVREYDDHPGFARWDARPGASRRIATFRSRDGRRFALVSALAHDGCGDFTGGLWALFEDTPHGLVETMSDGTIDTPLALADVDADGAPEVIFHSRIIDPSGSISVDVTTPSFDCPC